MARIGDIYHMTIARRKMALSRRGALRGERFRTLASWRLSQLYERPVAEIVRILQILPGRLDALPQVRLINVLLHDQTALIANPLRLHLSAT
jgi:hypothetical protein